MPGIPMTRAGIAAVRAFEITGAPLATPTKTYTISGTTRDASGAILPGCSLVLYRTADNSIAAQGVVSDATGAYVIAASPALAHYLVAYLAGSPDVAGTTINTLVGS